MTYRFDRVQGMERLVPGPHKLLMTIPEEAKEGDEIVLLYIPESQRAVNMNVKGQIGTNRIEVTFDIKDL